MGHRKQVLHLAKVVAAMFFLPHPYIVAPTGATDIGLHTPCLIPTNQADSHCSLAIIGSCYLQFQPFKT